jgi:nucleoid-associated protein Lsr2
MRAPMVTVSRFKPARCGSRRSPIACVFNMDPGAGLCFVYHLFCALFNERNGAHVAQKIQTLFIDDIDGSEAEGTVRFGLDGAEYEIDLNAKHAEALRKALAKYVDAARRSSGTARRPARSGGRRASATGVNTTEVREWAKAQGIDVKDRGRVPAELVVRFRAATGN